MNQATIPVGTRATDSQSQILLIPTNPHQKFHKSIPFVIALLFVFLLAYNGASVFSIDIHFPATIPPGKSNFSPESDSGKLGASISIPASSSSSSSSSVMLAVKEENPPPILKPYFPFLENRPSSILPLNGSSIRTLRRPKNYRRVLEILRPDASSRRFSLRVEDFLNSNSSPTCKVRFFMTWISSLDSFGSRELRTVESLFKSHPHACLIIVSNSMDSTEGAQLLKPLADLGFRVVAISPDFDYIFKNTDAELWFNRLKKGNVDPGEVSLGQNLSNVLRLALLYKYGGIYVDTDFVILKSLSKLRNAIGAQGIDPGTGNWTRLNNAVMVFDELHPLLFKFIQEFALTFDGNKWGHNGPYLVSRVAAGVARRPGYDFTVLPPTAFYPVDWSRIQGLYEGPRDENHLKWVLAKGDDLRKRSFGLHRWNKRTKMLEVEEGSVIHRIMSDCCILCNSSSLQVLKNA